MNKYNIDRVDFLNIDVEGFDYKVISSLDFEKIKPIMICIEDNNFNISNILNNKIDKLMRDKNYFLTSKIGVSLIYVLKEYENKIEKIMNMNTSSF